MNVFALDPGATCAGVAWFVDARLRVAKCIIGSDWKDTADHVRDFVLENLLVMQTAFVFERMQVYREQFLKGDPNDLITLMLMAGRVSSLAWTSVHEIFPRQWKGQQPKNISEQNVKNALHSDEFSCIELPTRRGLQHNVWDAIGIGLFHTRKERRQQQQDLRG